MDGAFVLSVNPPAGRTAGRAFFPFCPSATMDSREVPPMYAELVIFCVGMLSAVAFLAAVVLLGEWSFRERSDGMYRAWRRVGRSFP